MELTERTMWLERFVQLMEGHAASREWAGLLGMGWVADNGLRF